MPGGTHEQTINTAVGEVLADLCHGWRVRAERTGEVFVDGGRPDILIEEPAGWPVVIEGEVANRRQAETEAEARLGRQLVDNPRCVESAVALVYPEDLRRHDGRALRQAIRESAFEYIVVGSVSNSGRGRFPASGWLSGGIRDLAMLVRRISVPVSRVEELAIELENGIKRAAGGLTSEHPIGSLLGRRMATVLNQLDDEEGQTRRMAMTVIADALVFHAALAEAEMSVRNPRTRRPRCVKSPGQFRKRGAFQPTPLIDEWAAILEVNYWPVFHTAGSLLKELPTRSAVAVLDTLWATAEALIAGGVTKSHDLTGAVFQRLIADRKFLATFYTRPAAAALLAGLALPLHRPIGGSDWGDVNAMHALRIGDFACGTGTLLSTAYQRISLLHELHDGDPRALHRQMMKNGLVGLDVLNVGVHLTAAMLAGSHPDTPFDGECLLTMPYGEHPWGYSVGSLDLLPEQVSFPVMETAAETAGGKGPEEVRELMQRVGHGRFQLVIMNPPFTRHGAREGDRGDVHNPAFAAFEADEQLQNALAAHLRRIAGNTHAHGHAGLASHFVELAHRKTAASGRVALVLPMSSMAGQAWQGIRSLWRGSYRDIVVVSIAGRHSRTRSFSADTDIAECLVVATKGEPAGTQPRAFFVVLNGQPATALEGSLIARSISTAISGGHVRRLEDGPFGGTRITLGDTFVGEVADCPLPEAGGWHMACVSDMALGQTAHQLTNGRLWIEGMPPETRPTIPTAPIARVCRRIGPHHLDIRGSEIKADGLPQGPFRTLPMAPPGAAYPCLWNHSTRDERRLIVTPDTHGQLRQVDGRTPPELEDRAAARWATATRAHYNHDLQYNAHSLVVAMTERLCIGGTAWPSVILDDPEHEYAFSLWCNSTLGILCHWWSANPSHASRGRTTVTGIPLITTLDLSFLSPQQHASAKAVFEGMRDARLLPFDQIDEDPSRAELDRRLLVDVLGLDACLCEPNGPLAMLRQKLAAEPQIHGGKKTRVVFTADGEDSTERDDR